MRFRKNHLLPLLMPAFALLCALGLISATHAQTTAPATQPALASWHSQVTAFTNAMLADDAASIDQLVSDDCRVHQFDRTRHADLSQLRHSLSGAKRLVVRSYLEMPASLASDIAADVKDSGEATDDLKRRFVPEDAQMKRANATAAKWIESSLMSNGKDPIGVIVLLPTSADANSVPQPIFVLLRGESVDGHFRICEICYGDPLPPAKDSATASGQ